MKIRITNERWRTNLLPYLEIGCLSLIEAEKHGSTQFVNDIVIYDLSFPYELVFRKFRE